MNSLIETYCSPEWLEFVTFHKKVFDFPAKATIFKQGDLTEGFYTINYGKIKVITHEAPDKIRLVRLAADGDIFGHRGLFGNWKYPVSAITLAPTQALFLPIEPFTQVVKANSELSYQLIAFFVEELRLSEEKNIIMPVKNKLAKAILMNYRAFGFESEKSTRLSHTISRQDYADYIGTTYETIIRELSLLNKAEIIRTEGKTIIIRNLNALEKLAKAF